MLLDKGVTPIIVFDGSQLPIKSKVEAERRKRRKEYKDRGKALLREGKRSEAHNCFQKCIDVSSEMAHTFIKIHMLYTITRFWNLECTFEHTTNDIILCYKISDS